MIVGDYFHHDYVLELLSIVDALSPRARQIVVCDQQYKDALTRLFKASGIANVEYHVVDESSPLMAEWARDIAVAGTDRGGTAIIVSPDKHAASRDEAIATGEFLRGVLPGYDVRIAPFVFEGGNLAFLDSGDDRVVIIGRKILFDNEVYQRRPWAAGYDEHGLVDAIAETFGVDRVFVVGRERSRPDMRLYFEYHIDMGMAILTRQRAVVSRLVFDDVARDELAEAVTSDAAIISRFVGMDRAALLPELIRRLETVALEYDDYAVLLDSLGVAVHRSPVGWREVLGSMSWTNVVQVGDRILMPLYPDTLRVTTRSTSVSEGRTMVSLDYSRIADEQFDVSGRNGENLELYQRLGYAVVAVPEYLHYMRGGIHCFVNVLE
jgi:hypothetical protein